MTAVGRPLNYYGSKEKLCAAIHALIPPEPSTWVDLFCGSAIVTLKKPRHQRETINDLNRDVVNLFEVIRTDRAGELYAALELTPYSEGVLYDVYNTERDPDPVGQARRFLIESWFARGGDAHKTGFRWSKGQNTAPEMTWAKLPARLAAVAERLRGICIRNADALKLIDDYDTSDCILFVDPPYPGPVGRRYAVKMDQAAHQLLADRLLACKAKVILTMNPDTVYSRVLSNWIEHRVEVQGGGQAFKGERILTNFEPLPLLARAAQ